MAGLLSDLRDFGQGASNAAASTVSGPIDLLAMLMRKAGIPVPSNAVGGSEWMAQRGLTAQPKNQTAGLLGEAAGLISPIVAQAKAPQIARGLLQVGENAAKPSALRNVNQRGIFGGELAQTADKAALAKAKALEGKGTDPRAIWQETGWFKGGDGKWRFEIDDSAADVPTFKKHWLRPLEESMIHEPLEAAYPSVKNIMFEASPGGGLSGAQYTPNVKFHKWGEREALLLRNADESAKQNKSLALHELQHAIQEREGFAAGGSPDAMREAALKMLRRDVASGEIESTERAMSMLPMYQQNAYTRLAGEAEARAVQARMNMTPAQRRATFPLESYDVPISSLIYRGEL